MMIRQLRKKFILVAMCSMCVVFAVIVGSLNAVSFYGVISRADRILEMLAENNGRFPAKKFFPRGRFPELSLETPYDTRFFSVRLDGNGGVMSIDTGRIAAVETDEAAEYAKQVWKSGKQKGFLGDYRFLCRFAEQRAESRVIFVDCGRDLDLSRRLVLTSVGVALLGLLSVFLLVVIFSKRVFAPVEQSYLSQKRFVTDASHELKTPLTIISANVDILEMEEKDNQWIASIRNQVERLRGLTEQMVTLSRLDEEENVVFKTCKLSELAEETAAVFEPIAQAGGKKLTVEIAEGVTCMGDEDKLRQMLSLLLDNALKYASEQGEIRLCLEPARKGTRACLTVWNTVEEGGGIAPGSQNMLFERFYRPDASRSSKTGGSGIGLSIVKAIVDQHKGKITAESEDGKSIRFVITM